MDVKVFLLVVVLLNEAWLGRCCEKRVRYHTISQCTYHTKEKKIGTKTEQYFEKVCKDILVRRESRSVESIDLPKTDLLTRNGTHFSISLDENPCIFETYDLDNDGIISKEELEEKLSGKKETHDLFAIIDTMNDDGVISFSEFCAAIPYLIDECEGCCYV